MNIYLTELSSKDVTSILDTFRSNYIFRDRDVYNRYLEEQGREIRMTYISKVGDRIVGHISINFSPTILNLASRQVAMICDLFVFPQYRCRGIGTTLMQGRVGGLNFLSAVFTNISHDHLDYHDDFKEYINTKKKLFDDLGQHAYAIYNADDPNGKIIVQNTRAATIPYSIHSDTDHKLKIIINSIEGMELKIDDQSVWVRLIGYFNAYNILAAYTTAVSLGEDRDKVLTFLSEIDPPKGRFQVIKNSKNIFCVVDYAHTPEALKNLLSTINQIKEKDSSTITVVGCGGNRDASKRPLMGKIASKLSEKVIFTSDNPRDEDPSEIISQMQSLIETDSINRTITIIDREEAIKTACLMAQERDIVVVAGKGHEAYQVIKGEYKPFDDLIVIKNFSG